MTSAARLWIDEALRLHGEPLDDGRVRIARSQAALAREAACSAGTIAYYLHDLGDAVSVTRDAGVVVDPAAMRPSGDELARRRCRSADVAETLARTFGRPPDARRRVELLDETDRTPSVRQMAVAVNLNASTTQRHIDRLTAQGRLLRSDRRLYLLDASDPAADSRIAHRPAAGPGLTQSSQATTNPELMEVVVGLATALVSVAEDLARIGQQLLDLVHQDDGEVVRQPANKCAPVRGNSQLVRAPVAEFRDCAHSIAGLVPSESLMQIEEDFLSVSNPREETRANARSPRVSRGRIAEAKLASPTSRKIALSTAEEVASALVPLRRACERLSVSDVVDERGRRWLALYSPQELSRAVGRVICMARAGQVRAPMSLLVAKAMATDDALFELAAEAPPALVPPILDEEVPEVDEEAERAVANMSAPELALLDAEVRAHLEAIMGGRRRSVEGAMGDEAAMARWRQMLWREGHGRGAEDEHPRRAQGQE